MMTISSDKKMQKYAKKVIELDFASSFFKQSRIDVILKDLENKKISIVHQGLTATSVKSYTRGLHWQSIVDIYQGNPKAVDMLYTSNRMVGKAFEFAYCEHYYHHFPAEVEMTAPHLYLASILSAYHLGQDEAFINGIRWMKIYIKEEADARIVNTDELEGFMHAVHKSHEADEWCIAGPESFYHQFFKPGLDLEEVVQEMLDYRIEKIDEVFSRRRTRACMFADSANPLYPFEVFAYIRLYNRLENTQKTVEHPYLLPFDGLPGTKGMNDKTLNNIEQLIDKKIDQIKNHKLSKGIFNRL